MKLTPGATDIFCLGSLTFKPSIEPNPSSQLDLYLTEQGSVVPLGLIEIQNRYDVFKNENVCITAYGYQKSKVRLEKVF